jgi:hypothetical protein
MENKKYNVTSKFNGYVSVSLLNSGIKYVWNNINSSLDLTKEEIKQILNTPGGRDILENKVIISDADILKELNLNVEPEYFYTEKDIEDLLKNGSIDQLQDALDFAPEGTVDLIVETATKMKLEDRNKLKIIKESTGFDVESMIDISADNQNEQETTERTRRAAPYKPEVTPTSDTISVKKYKRI